VNSAIPFQSMSGALSIGAVEKLCDSGDAAWTAAFLGCCACGVTIKERLISFRNSRTVPESATQSANRKEPNSNNSSSKPSSSRQQL
jgi:hypothetical protein